jgi:hypothetical protein
MWASFSGRSGVWMVGAGLALGVACAGKSDPPPQGGTGAGATGGRGLTTGGVGGTAGRGGSSGRGGTGGKAGSANQGGEGGEPIVVDPDGPIVEVTSPPELEAPGDGDVLVDSEVTVKCEARPSAGGQPVDASTVSIQLLDAEDNVLDEVAAAPTGEDNEYSAVLILEKVEENGVVGFRCIAGDTTSPPLIGSDTIHSFVDHGPSIALVAPAEMSVHPLASMTFEFTVTEAPVARRDPGADVDSVTLTVGVVDVPVGSPDSDGTYQVAADLSDAEFGAEAGEVAFAIVARTARGGVRTLSSSFILDDEGPTITIESPDQGSVVGSRIPVVFTVTDDYSAVDPDSVVVSIAGADTRFDGGPNWRRSGDKFTCYLDSSETGRSDFQATISVRARDEAGNDALAETRLVYLDNHPPLVDLIPPNVRERRRIDGGGYECSASFDPVGPWAPEDLQQIPNHFFPRAVIWEKSNEFGQMYVHLSGLDDATAHLFFNPTPGEPLLIDNDDDPECDEIDEAILRSDSGVVLDPVRSDGSPFWGPGDASADPPLVSCVLGSDSTAQDGLCLSDNSDLTRVIEHEMIMLDSSQHPPVIYAADVDDGGLECTGTDWEMGSLANGEGWLCFAARAVDNAGNVGVSRPIRLCHDNPNTAAVPACVNDPQGMTAPSCMDNCTAPAPFDELLVDI